MYHRLLQEKSEAVHLKVAQQNENEILHLFLFAPKEPPKKHHYYVLPVTGSQRDKRNGMSYFVI